MSFSFAMSKLAPPLIDNIPSNGKKLNLTIPRQKEKVVLIAGATGVGKSKLSVDLAARFWPADIINSDKMQVYAGLDIVTNKITKEEQRGVYHYLLGTENPDSEFTATDFRESASLAVESITSHGHLPIIVGGSNSYIETLVDDEDYKFRSRYDVFCLWVDVWMPILHSYIEKRVDQMFGKGMLNELRPFFNPNGDYSRGIRKAIGVPEFDCYFRMEPFADERTKRMLLEEALNEMKENTWKLARKQVGKIERLRNLKRWKMHRIDATAVFRKEGEEADEAWKKLVAEPSALIVAKFLRQNVTTHVPANVGGLQLPDFRKAVVSTTC